MKKTNSILVVHGGMSLVLLAAIVLGARAPAPPISSAQTGRSENASTITNVTYRVLKEETPAPAAPALFHWSSVESTDYREYIAHLRRIECPEPTIQDIIVAEINKLYAPKEAPLKAKAGTTTEDYGELTTAAKARQQAEVDKRKQLRQVQKEKNAVLQQLLGIELPLDPLLGTGSRDYEAFEAAFNSLPKEKRELVREIQEAYWQASDGLNDKYNHRRTPEYLEEYKRINLERKEKLAKVLDEAEAEEYDMRTSGLAATLRYTLDKFKPTEEEFRQIYRLRKAIEQPYVGNLSAMMAEDAAGNAVVSSKSYSQSQKAADEELRKVLGQTRYAEYERSQDYTYRSLSDLGERFGLAQEAIVKTYEAQKTYREEQQKLRADRNLFPADRQTKLQELKRGLDTQMLNLLGQRAAKAWERNRGGGNVLVSGG